GVNPSPQTFSRGNVVFSSTSTSSPAVASQYAALLPDGPAPTTMTSAVPARARGPTVGASPSATVSATAPGPTVGASPSATVPATAPGPTVGASPSATGVGRPAVIGAVIAGSRFTDSRLCERLHELFVPSLGASSERRNRHPRRARP